MMSMIQSAMSYVVVERDEKSDFPTPTSNSEKFAKVFFILELH